MKRLNHAREKETEFAQGRSKTEAADNRATRNRKRGEQVFERNARLVYTKIVTCKGELSVKVSDGANEIFFLGYCAVSLNFPKRELRLRSGLATDRPEKLQSLANSSTEQNP